MNSNIILIHKNDSFFEVYQKINHASKSGQKDVVLMMPKKALFFHDVYGISLLLFHFPGIRFSIITKNKPILQLCRRLGIQGAKTLKEFGSSNVSFGHEVLRENFSFVQFLIWITRKYILQAGTRWRIGYERSRAYMRSTKSSLMMVFIFGVGIAILLLASILFFTLPKTTVIIEPSVFLKPTKINVVFLEESLISGTYEYEVPIQRYTYSIAHEESFVVRNFDTSLAGQAKGMARVYNFSNEPFRLRPGTRFETSEGLIFRSSEWIVLPRGNGGNSYVDVELEADFYDIHSIYMGERANIESGVAMTVPGLEGSAMFDEIRAETMSIFEGGDNNVVAVFSDKQYDEYLSLFTEKMAIEAERDMLHTLDEVQEGFYVLPIHGITRPVDIKVTTSHNPGQITPEVTYSGVGEFETVIFDLSEVHKHIIHASSDHLLEDLQQLVSTPKGMVDIVHVFSQEVDPYKIKATVQADIAYKYQLDSPEMMDMFLDNFLAEILGKKEDEAKRTLLNNAMISDVKIQITPFWKNTISYSPKDVVFKIRD